MRQKLFVLFIFMMNPIPLHAFAGASHRWCVNVFDVDGIKFFLCNRMQQNIDV